MKPTQDLDWDIVESVRKHSLHLKGYTGGALADFRHKILRGVMLAGTDLPQAAFTGADMRGANFSGANLSGAEFSRPSLSGPTLRAQS